jgi:hypothetical protein
MAEGRAWKTRAQFQYRDDDKHESDAELEGIDLMPLAKERIASPPRKAR